MLTDVQKAMIFAQIILTLHPYNAPKTQAKLFS